MSTVFIFLRLQGEDGKVTMSVEAKAAMEEEIGRLAGQVADLENLRLANAEEIEGLKDQIANFKVREEEEEEEESVTCFLAALVLGLEFKPFVFLYFP